MLGFIDIHSHILPNVDDGSKSLEQSLNMIKTAYCEGIRIIVATPHYRLDVFECDYNKVKGVYDDLVKHVKSIYPDMDIYLGNEIMFADDIPDLLENDKLMTINKSNYVLVEFRPSVSYRDLKDGLNRIELSGKTPILAHVERYECLVQNVLLLSELKDSGVCIQVNSASIMGEGGRKIKSFIKKILKNELADVIATDTHSDGRRSPLMKESFRYVSKKYGDDYARKLFVINPQAIINNKYID